MNTLLDQPPRPTETFGPGHDDVWVVKRTTGGFPSPDRHNPGRLKTTSGTIVFRRDDLERAHWKKVWRSMFED